MIELEKMGQNKKPNYTRLTGRNCIFVSVLALTTVFSSCSDTEKSSASNLNKTSDATSNSDTPNGAESEAFSLKDNQVSKLLTEAQVRKLFNLGEDIALTTKSEGSSDKKDVKITFSWQGERSEGNKLSGDRKSIVSARVAWNKFIGNGGGFSYLKSKIKDDSTIADAIKLKAVDGMINGIKSEKMNGRVIQELDPNTLWEIHQSTLSIQDGKKLIEVRCDISTNNDICKNNASKLLEQVKQNLSSL